MAAIVRPGAEPPLSIELWTYDQHNSKDVLQPLGPPMQILRLDPEASPLPALSVLRRQLAAPGTTVVRPIGLAEERTEPFLGLLTGAARVARDSDAEPKTRVDALARLVRGLDDTLLLERDALAETAEALAGGPWMVEREEQLSSRRRQAHVRTPDGHKTVVLMKKEGGWVLSDVRP